MEFLDRSPWPFVKELPARNYPRTILSKIPFSFHSHSEETQIMNEEYLRLAVMKTKELCAQRGEPFDLRLFITGVSKRAAQLAKGYRRLIPLTPGDDTPLLDLALREVAAGKILIEKGDYHAIEQAERDNTEIASVNE